MLYQLKMFEQALEELKELVDTDGDNPKVHFYMGRILSRGETHTEAVLHFEQVIKLNEDPFLSCNALLEIAKLRIIEKDFYEAYYNLKRISLYNYKSTKLEHYQIFTEGVLYLIKRKVKKGVQSLTSLIEAANSKTSSSATTLKPKLREPAIISTTTLHREHSGKDTLDSFLKPLVFVYRAYGYIALESYEKAINDLMTASKISKLDF